MKLSIELLQVIGEPWGCCQVELEGDWPEPVPAQRGQQKKVALQKSQEDGIAKPGQKSKDGVPRTYPAHKDLGTLRLTLGAKKSYIVAGMKEIGVPQLLAELTEKAVGQNHQNLMLELCRCASTNKLSREEIKELRDVVLKREKSTCLREPHVTIMSMPSAFLSFCPHQATHVVTLLGEI